ncbi:hypothetical protein BEWA_025580 [Theileria equi strain WA]|uniref:Uncharacterized protein n=1 Tax=Theileria equi strain WA TaxID=1537102 RepID=L0AXS2_THEEQ|nr:hypothetical protein BEWA_025580 [Theileria equi strain WA]AFZ79709.1 hypothetical protein BEWA_025580 [Theileria equi strain WA]|eukprot:XP_004829375.1 hypothetical protein BEWA_025580 [Theileria equi strain WA]
MDKKRQFEPRDFWLFGGVLLSIPSSFGAYLAKGIYGYKAGLVTEVLLLVSSFFWMAIGTIEYGVDTGKQVGKYCNESRCQKGQCGCNGGQTCEPEKCTSKNCPCCKEWEGTYASLNTFTSQGLMIVLAFTGDGYLKTYSKYEHDRSKWPTKDYGFWKSLGYWTGSGVSEACKSVKSSFTTNVRCKVLGKSEALLIVYADQEF